MNPEIHLRPQRPHQPVLQLFVPFRLFPRTKRRTDNGLSIVFDPPDHISDIPAMQYT